MIRINFFYTNFGILYVRYNYKHISKEIVEGVTIHMNKDSYNREQDTLTKVYFHTIIKYHKNPKKLS